MLYVDVDAVVHENCTEYYEQIDADFAAHWFQGPAGGYASRNDNLMLSGTVWFADNQASRALLTTWYMLNSLWRDRGLVQGGGQKNLWFTVTCSKGLRIHDLPGRYCYVFDKPFGYPEGEPKIIEHLIASRENRGPSIGTVNEPRRQRMAELDGVV